MTVCLDTNIVIYYVERDPIWAPKVEGRLRSLAVGGHSLAVADAARLECFVGPLQLGDLATLADYRTFFQLPEIQMLPITGSVWELAAEIRVQHSFNALDSIHLAAAIEHGCGAFLTNDSQLSRCKGIKWKC